MNKMINKVKQAWEWTFKMLKRHAIELMLIAVSSGLIVYNVITEVDVSLYISIFIGYLAGSMYHKNKLINLIERNPVKWVELLMSDNKLDIEELKQ